MQDEKILRVFEVIFHVIVSAPMLWLIFIYPWVS
jgi:hypothetical protein